MSAAIAFVLSAREIVAQRLIQLPGKLNAYKIFREGHAVNPMNILGWHRFSTQDNPKLPADAECVIVDLNIGDFIIAHVNGLAQRRAQHQMVGIEGDPTIIIVGVKKAEKDTGQIEADQNRGNAPIFTRTNYLGDKI